MIYSYCRGSRVDLAMTERSNYKNKTKKLFKMPIKYLFYYNYWYYLLINFTRTCKTLEKVKNCTAWKIVYSCFKMSLQKIRMF